MNDADDDLQPPPPRFTLRGVALAFFVLCVMLAGIRQCGFIGFVVGAYVSGLTIGAYFRSWKTMTACFCGLTIFLLSFVCAWWSSGIPAHLDRWYYMAVESDLKELTAATERFAQEYDELPKDLNELAVFLDKNRVPPRWKDRGPALHTSAEGIEIVYLGRDKAPGGVGLDADVTLKNFDQVTRTRVPFRQFLGWRGLGAVVMPALIASLFAANIGRLIERPSRGSLVAVSAIIAVSLLAAGYMAAFHIAASQSGH